MSEFRHRREDPLVTIARKARDEGRSFEYTNGNRDPAATWAKQGSCAHVFILDHKPYVRRSSQNLIQAQKRAFHQRGEVDLSFFPRISKENYSFFCPSLLSAVLVSACRNQKLENHPDETDHTIGGANRNRNG